MTGSYDRPFRPLEKVQGIPRGPWDLRGSRGSMRTKVLYKDIIVSIR